MQAELTWGIKMEWLKAGTRSDMRKTPHCWQKKIFAGKEGKAGRGTKCEWFLPTDGNLGKNWQRMKKRENGDNQSHNKHISTNAYICDLENKANFSEAAFTASYPYRCV